MPGRSPICRRALWHVKSNKKIASKGGTGGSNTMKALTRIALLLGAAAHLHAAELSTIETDDLRLLYFDPSETYLTPYVVRSFTNSIAHQRKLFDYEPSEEVSVLLTDFTDWGNAGAIAVPRNALLVDIAPTPFTFETSDTAERMYSLMNHELVHVVSMEQAASVDEKYRKFFGGKVETSADHPETILYSYLTNPRRASPRWYKEGIAVFIETWMAGGLGRAQGPYNEMVFRSKVRDGAQFYDPLGLVAEGTRVDFQVGANAYLYGTRFINYLAYTFSPEHVIDWIKRTDDTERFYSAQFEKVFGLSIDEAWQDWVAFEKEHQQTNLDALREFPITPYENLTAEALGSVSRAFMDSSSNTLYMGVRRPGELAHITALALDEGTFTKYEDIKGPMLYTVTSPALDPDSRTFFYTTDNTNYRDLVALDLESGKTRILLKDARIGNLALNPVDKSLWGVRHLNGIATLVRVPAPYTEWNQVQSLPYGELYYDLDISPDGKLLSTSHGEINGDQSLRVFDIAELLEGAVEPVTEFDFGLSVPESFVFSPDGKYLFGSSYYTGVSNIFRYELETGELEAVSNAETGFFRPIPVDDGSLIVFHYTGFGFVPARIDPVPLDDVNPITFLGTRVVRKHPQLKDWQVPSPASVDLDAVITDEGTYSPGASMGFESMHPIVEGYKDEWAVGMNFNFSDPIMLNTLSLSASYSPASDLPSDENTHISLDYQHIVVSNSPLAGVWKAGASLNRADFYDLFGPTKQSRKGQRYYVGYEKTLLYDEPRRLGFSAELSHNRDMDALPRYQNIPATFDRLSTFYMDLEYEHLRRSLGAVDDEKGYRWALAATTNYVDGDTIPKIGAEFDFGFALPWRHSSIWFRNAAGGAFGEPDDEFANFFFGGFGNNYVDSGEIKRYREYYAFPGLELNALPGRNFYRGMLEWNLPPIRFERAGHANFYLAYARPAIFASTITTNLDDDVLKYNAHNIGMQVDFHIEFLSRLTMTLSVGYAKAYGEADFTDDEFMISLKIM
jgi:hypothetical protein